MRLDGQGCILDVQVKTNFMALSILCLTSSCRRNDITTSSVRMDKRQTGLWDTLTLGHWDTGTLDCKNDSDIFDIQLQRKHPSSFPCSCISPYHLIQIDLQIYSRHRMRALSDFQAWSKSSPANPTMLIHSVQIRRHAFSA